MEKQRQVFKPSIFNSPYHTLGCEQALPLKGLVTSQVFSWLVTKPFNGRACSQANHTLSYHLLMVTLHFYSASCPLTSHLFHDAFLVLCITQDWSFNLHGLLFLQKHARREIRNSQEVCEVNTRTKVFAFSFRCLNKKPCSKNCKCNWKVHTFLSNQP